MEEYNLHMRRDVFEQVTSCIRAYVENNAWLTVKVLGNLIEADLSSIFGNGDLGWSPTTLLYRCQATTTECDAYVSMPKPEELPRTASPVLADQVNDMTVAMRDAICFLRRWAGADNHASMPAELVNQLSEMRTLIHTLIGTGENCCDETTYEHAEAVRKSTRLDAMDAFSYAIRALFERKGTPGVKRALNSIYGTAAYDGYRLSDALKRAAIASQEGLHNAINGSSEDADAPSLDHCGCENVRADEPNALFVTIETSTFDPTLENVEAVQAFISNAGEGRDIHFRII